MIKKKLNIQICELIGAFIGDGFLSKSKYTMGISGDKNLDKDYLYYLSKIIKNNFSFTNPHLYHRKDECTLVLKTYSKELFQYFKFLGFNPGLKSKSVKIPSIILNNNKFMKVTVKGIFDTDGCVFFDNRKEYRNPYPRITLQIASLPLIKQLESYLSKNFSLYVNKSNRDGYRNYIEIYGHKQLETFLKQIGFSNLRHLSKIRSRGLVV